MNLFTRMLALYRLYSEQMQKIHDINGQFTNTFAYIRGTILSFRFEKRAFICARGRLKIFNHGIIDVDNFVSFDPDVELFVSWRLPSSNHLPKLSIGSMSQVGIRTQIHVGERVVIGKHVRIGWDSMIMDRDYHAVPGKKEEKTAPIIIEDNVWIGCRAMILKGVTIGHDSVVGAGSVVTKNVNPCTMVAGNPARVVKKGLPSQPFPIRVQDYLLERAPTERV